MWIMGQDTTIFLQIHNAPQQQIINQMWQEWEKQNMGK